MRGRAVEQNSDECEPASEAIDMTNGNDVSGEALVEQDEVPPDI